MQFENEIFWRAHLLIATRIERRDLLMTSLLLTFYFIFTWRWLTKTVLPVSLHRSDIMLKTMNPGIKAFKFFDVFHRSDKAHRRNSTGVGLAIVHGMIAEYKGSICMEANLNDGTTFLFLVADKNCKHGS